jgi:phosphoribosylformimino-5-aminoimidazole carboxamide ribotide isomerase
VLVIPAVDVLDGKVVRLLRGSFSEVTVYGDDPIAVAISWIETGADLVHLVDLEGARSGQPDRSLWERFAAAAVPFQVGGGIRDVATARSALEAGAARVVLGTAAVWNPQILAEIGSPAKVVAAIDVADGEALGEGWSGKGLSLGSVLDGLRTNRVERMLLTSISRDGTMSGPDVSLIEKVRTLAPEMALIASGGVGALRDLQTLADAGCEAAIVGRAIYEKRFTIEEARRIA